ncbi:MAG: PD40 domain-containing protein [Acidobacteria bacterium]|nr:PD40 domain-containing protein [Acidobacteriota bacterium]
MRILAARAGAPILLAAALVSLAACAGKPGSDRGEAPILLVSDRGGAPRIFEIAPGGGPARMVGSSPQDDRPYRDCMPARLPDGRIAFVSDRDGNQKIYLASADGRTVTRLTTDPGDPAAAATDSAPAPLGREAIVFARSAPGDPAGARDLFIMRLDGAGMRRITRHPADDRAPAGAPDGRAVVFVSERSGTPRVHRIADAWSEEPETEVADLSDPRPSPPATHAPSQAFADEAPAFLPDGSIVFSRTPAGGVPHLVHAGAGGAGAGLRQFTDSLTLRFGAGEPVALPDGSVLFTTGPVPLQEGMDAPVRFAVYRIALGGFNLSRVTRDRVGYNDHARGFLLCR